jgi:flagellar hook-length control protein FliK
MSMPVGASISPSTASSANRSSGSGSAVSGSAAPVSSRGDGFAARLQQSIDDAGSSNPAPGADPSVVSDAPGPFGAPTSLASGAATGEGSGGGSGERFGQEAVAAEAPADDLHAESGIEPIVVPSVFTTALSAAGNSAVSPASSADAAPVTGALESDALPAAEPTVELSAAVPTAASSLFAASLTASDEVSNTPVVTAAQVEPGSPTTSVRGGVPQAEVSQGVVPPVVVQPVTAQSGPASPIAAAPPVAPPAVAPPAVAPLTSAQRSAAPTTAAASASQSTAAQPSIPPSAPTLATQVPATAASAPTIPAATEPALDVTAPNVPAVAAAPVQPTAPSAVVAPAASVVPVTPVPLATQVAAPMFSLAGAKPGEHVLVINVTPDTLGPVTVRAHVTVDSVRVELFAPTDAGRDALRAILPDLRRDLAGSGLNTNLDLSSQNQPSDPHTDRQARPTRVLQPAGDGSTPTAADSASRPREFASASTIDVLA